MTAKLSPDLVRALAAVGDDPLPVENPRTKQVYYLVDVERFDVVPRSRRHGSAREGWTEDKNRRRCALIRQKFSQGISAAEARELAQLQKELSAHRKRLVPLPYDVADVLRDALSPSAGSPATRGR